MARCNQATITDAAFAHLKGIKYLFMTFCDQSTITGATIFPNLCGASYIETTGCRQEVKDAAKRVLDGTSCNASKGGSRKRKRRSNKYKSRRRR